MPRLKPVAVAGANRAYLELIRRGWRTHHLDGRIAWMEPPSSPSVESAESVHLDWLAEHYRSEVPQQANADELADWETEQAREEDDEQEDERWWE